MPRSRDCMVESPRWPGGARGRMRRSEVRWGQRQKVQCSDRFCVSGSERAPPVALLLRLPNLRCLAPNSILLPMSAPLFHPAVDAWFGKHFAAATEPQVRAWPLIQSGKNVLIAAPTGSGKTLAAFLSAIDELVRLGAGMSTPTLAASFTNSAAALPPEGAQFAPPGGPSARTTTPTLAASL